MWTGPELLRVGPNVHGQDWLVGDLHGHRSLLDAELHRCGFDPQRDRLFSTADLIDRGAESLECLRLLDEPWFFAVLGNHERMLLARLKAQAAGPLLRWQTHLYANHWDRGFTPTQREELTRLLDQVRRLPLAIRVEALVPFWVVHAQRPSPRGAVWTDAQMVRPGALYTRLEALTWSRRVARNALWLIQMGAPVLDIPQPNTPLAPFCAGVHLDGVLPLWEPSVGLTYTGHTIVPRPILHRSHLFIDGGPYKPGGRLNLLRHDAVIAALASTLPELPLPG